MVCIGALLGVVQGSDPEYLELVALVGSTRKGLDGNGRLCGVTLDHAIGAP